MPVRLIQHAFTGGEIAPTLYARSDVEKHATSLETMRNFYAVAHGAAKSRPGQLFVGDVYDPQFPSRLVEFSFNDEQTYVLELSNFFMRVIRDGALVKEEPDITGAATSAATPVVVTVAHDLRQGQKLTFTSGVGTANADLDGKDFFVNLMFDGAAVSIGSIAYDDSVPPVASDPFSVVIEAPAHPWSNGDKVLISGLPEVDDLVTGAVNNRWLNDRVFTIQDVTPGFFEIDLNEVTAEDALKFVQEDGATISGTAQKVDLTQFELHTDSTGTQASSSTSTTGKQLEVFAGVTTPWAAADVRRVKFAQSSDVITITHPDYPTYELIRGANNYTWDLRKHENTASTVTPPLNLTSDNAGGGSVRAYVVTAIDAETGDESRPSDIVVTDEYAATLSWEAPKVGVAERYFIYAGGPIGDEQFGLIGTTVATKFDLGGRPNGPGITPDFTVTFTQQKYPFKGAGNFPRCIAYIDQRLALAGTKLNPAKIWLSAVASFKTFAASFPVAGSDAIEATIDSQDASPIQELISATDLYALTSKAAFVISGNQAGVISASGGFQARDQNNWGISNVRALQIGDVVVYVQADGNAVRDLAYVFETDKHQAADLTVLSKHLFENDPIVEWAYAKSPDSIVWCVRDSGSLLSLTYLREQRLFAWARHDTLFGKYESVASVLEGNEDATYFVVDRTEWDGTTRRWIERQVSRKIDDVRDAVCLDGALQLTGSTAVPYTGTTPLVAQGAVQVNGSTVDIRIGFSPSPAPGIVAGDLIDVEHIIYGDDDAAVETPGSLHNKRFRVRALAAGPNPAYILEDQDSGDDIDNAFVATEAPVPGKTKVRKCVTTVDGLDHLETFEVSILADGNVLPKQTVPASGQLTLPVPASRVAIGLPYKCDIRTLEPAPNVPGRSKQSIPKLVSEVVFRVDRTRGGKAGSTAADLKPIKQRSSEDYYQPIELLSGELHHNMGGGWRRGQIMYRQDEPLPSTIMAIVYEAEFGN